MLTAKVQSSNGEMVGTQAAGERDFESGDLVLLLRGISGVAPPLQCAWPRVPPAGVSHFLPELLHPLRAPAACTQGL